MTATTQTKTATQRYATAAKFNKGSIYKSQSSANPDYIGFYEVTRVKDGYATVFNVNTNEGQILKIYPDTYGEEVVFVGINEVVRASQETF